MRYWESPEHTERTQWKLPVGLYCKDCAVPQASGLGYSVVCPLSARKETFCLLMWQK